MFQSTNLIEFVNKFQTADDCYQYLEQMRWGNGYKCPKCSSSEYRTGNKRYYRRCLSCGCHESLTANTFFHKLKFDILKAFHICFRLSSKKGISTYEIAKQYGINQKSAWLFKRKFQEGFHHYLDKSKLKNEVEVDEFVVGKKDKGNPGRRKGNKKQVMIMVEKIGGNRLGNIRLEQIKNYSKVELESKMNQRIEEDTKIVTDKYSTYESMKIDNPNIETKYSNKGKNFPELHQIIANFKGWLRGIHHKVSEFHFQNYLNEFAFRHNHRNYEKGIFQTIISNLLAGVPKTRYQLSNVAI